MFKRDAVRLIGLAGIVPLLLVFLSPQAQAQLNNRPYSFNTPDGGVGMSAGGRQAIINEELTDATPDNLVRGSRGELLNLREGPGKSAIVSVPGGNVIPGFKGSTFRNPGDAAGVFNAFFTPRSSAPSYVSYISFTQQSGGIIDTWTSRAVNNRLTYFGGRNPIDAWTGIVYSTP